jgi:predicted O-methyltransferase YrrM
MAIENVGQQASDGLTFTVDWFDRAIPSWRDLLPRAMPAPHRIIEIGAFEGRATCFMLAEVLPPDVAGEIHCIDTWQGGVEHSGIAMNEVLERFRANVTTAIRQVPQHKVLIHRKPSAQALLDLLRSGAHGTFDFAYIDGSHQAPDVLEDLVLTFRLMRPGGLVICDDYSWQLTPSATVDVLDTPKIAVDAFTTIFRRKIHLPTWPSSYQAAFVKLSD